MNKKKILLAAFILIALVQLFIPASMIWSREKILSQGTVFKFRAAPIDPNDPFRGKYIMLSFKEMSLRVSNEKNWTDNEPVYVRFSTGHDGFARIRSISNKRPMGTADYVKANINYVSTNDKFVFLDYPFERFYMEESKAGDAEIAYRESLRDSTHITYGLVRVMNGDAVLQDVLIDGRSIREIVKARQGK